MNILCHLGEVALKNEICQPNEVGLSLAQVAFCKSICTVHIGHQNPHKMYYVVQLYTCGFPSKYHCIVSVNKLDFNVQRETKVLLSLYSTVLSYS